MGFTTAYPYIQTGSVHTLHVHVTYRTGKIGSFPGKIGTHFPSKFISWCKCRPIYSFKCPPKLKCYGNSMGLTLMSAYLNWVMLNFGSIWTWWSMKIYHSNTKYRLNSMLYNAAHIMENGSLQVNWQFTCN